MLFIEPEVQPAEDPLMRRLTLLAQPERVMWRQILTSPRFDAPSAAAADNAKTSIAWPITIKSEREPALGFGATGLLTSNVMELVSSEAAGASR